MTDNYIYVNGVLTIPKPPQPATEAVKSTPAAPQAKVKTDKAKTRINLYLDNDILKTLCERAELTGKCYETLINETLRHSLTPESAPLTIETLRLLLQEEFSKYVNLIEDKNHSHPTQYT